MFTILALIRMRKFESESASVDNIFAYELCLLRTTFLFFIINSLMYKVADLLNPLHRDNNGMFVSKSTRQNKKRQTSQRSQCQTVYLLNRLVSKSIQTHIKLIKEIILHGNFFFAFF